MTLAELDWTVFERLPGAQTTNFELLCRELVRRNYERHGDFRSFTQQAGVEFHLKVGQSCDLGKPPSHWGWQCRWYTDVSGKQIGKRRRTKVEDAIRTTEKHLPDLTDWVLWTRKRLTPEDQKWFFAIESKFKLRHWSEEEVLGLLSGAEVLRQTYFGELVFTEADFCKLHEEAMAPIKKRWEPALHVEVDAETKIKGVLGAPGTWPEIRQVGSDLRRRVQRIEAFLDQLREDEQLLVSQFAQTLQASSDHLNNLASALDEGSLREIRKLLDAFVRPTVSKPDVAKLAATLRTVNLPASTPITAAMWHLGNYFDVLQRLQRRIDVNLIAVVGDAGFGKTYLAAELTKPSGEQPGGILLQGKYLSQNGSLVELVDRIEFGGSGVDELLEAIDAAGARLDRKIPLVIDGLNEAEDPRTWMDQIATLEAKTNRLANCAVILTLRSAVAEEALPEEVSTIHLSGFTYDRQEAVETYFEYYKIDPTDALLPWQQFRSPLFLSLFCQATNSEREHTVGVESIPRSLNAVFGKYREVVAMRAAEKLGMAKDDVVGALRRVGAELWDSNARAFDFDKLRELVGDGPRDWQSSLARVLEEEGVLSRDLVRRLHIQETPSGNQVSAILYDAFAGFVVADAITHNQTVDSVRKLIDSHWSRLDTSTRDHHPLAEDIVAALVGLFAEKYRSPLWKIVPERSRAKVLIDSIDLPAELIDEDTVAELQKQPLDGSAFRTLMTTRSIANHPMNSEFLNGALMGLSVADRDLNWTEWVRRNREALLKDIEVVEQDWRRSSQRNESDRLLAMWTCWYLTSSVRYFRDHATRALYWYGLGAPRPFFELVVSSLKIDDPYISERMLAATYGVVMGNQNPSGAFATDFQWLLEQLAAHLLSCGAKSPTNHWTSRQYVQGIFDFAQHLPGLETTAFPAQRRLVFEQADYVHASSVQQQYSGHLDMDFEHDEVGRLFEDRRKYQDDPDGFNDAMKEINGRIHALGWRAEKFRNIDSQLSQSRYRRSPEPSLTDTYAMKYARCAVQEKAGVLADAGEIPNDRRTQWGSPVTDIDPSFPLKPRPLEIEISCWLQPDQSDNREWLASGRIHVPNELQVMESFEDATGTWISVDGYLRREDRINGRSTFGFIRAILVLAEETDQLVGLLKSRDYLGNHYIPEEPSDYYTFAGEIPWSPEFCASEDYDENGPYIGTIGGRNSGIAVETLSHRYSWQDYHSAANNVGGFSVPSLSFSREYGLTSAASGFNQFAPDGSLASISLAPPKGFNEDGNVLYLRSDLLRAYAESRGCRIVWTIWGERNLTNFSIGNHPDWSRDIYQRYEHVWREVRLLG